MASMKHHTVSLILRDHRTGREYPVLEGVSSRDLAEIPTSPHHQQSLWHGLSTALNPIQCQELVED